MEQSEKIREADRLSQQFDELRDQFQNFEKEFKNWKEPETTADTVQECLRRINRVLTRLEEAPDQQELLNLYIKLATENGGRGILFLSKEDKMKSWKGQAINDFGKTFEASHPNNPVVRAHKERRIIAFSDPRPGTFEEYDPQGAVEAACIPLAFGPEVPAVLYLDSPERLDLEWLGLLTHLTCFHMRSRLADSRTLAHTSAEQTTDLPTGQEGEESKSGETDRVSSPEASEPVPEEASEVIEQEAQLGASEEEPRLARAAETAVTEGSAAALQQSTAEPPQESADAHPPVPSETAWRESSQGTTSEEGSDPSTDSAATESTLAEEIESLGGSHSGIGAAASETAVKEPEESKTEEEPTEEATEEAPEEKKKKASMLEEYLRSIVQGATKTPEPKAAPAGQEEEEETEGTWEQDTPAIDSQDRARTPDTEEEKQKEARKEPEKPAVSRSKAVPGRGPELSTKEEDEEGSLHEDARRFARLLVSEIKLYNEDSVKEGRESGNLYAHLKRDIERSRDMYEKRVHPDVKGSRDYFHEALIQILAGNDESLMGPGYPGPTQK